MRKQLEPVSVNLDPDLYEFLRTLADKQGLPLSVYVRQLAIRGLNMELCDFQSWRHFKNKIEDHQNL